MAHEQRPGTAHRSPQAQARSGAAEDAAQGEAGAEKANLPGQARPEASSILAPDWSPSSVLEQAQLPFCVTALDGRFLYANQAFRELLGWGPAQIPTMFWPDDVCPGPLGSEADDQEEQLCEEVLLGGSSVRQRLLLRTREGRPLSVEADRHLGTDETGRPAYFFTFLHLPAARTEDAGPLEGRLQAPPLPSSPAALPLQARLTLSRILGEGVGTRPGRTGASQSAFERALAAQGAEGWTTAPLWDAARLAESMDHGLAHLLAEFGIPEASLSASVLAQCLPVPQETALFLDFMVFELLYGALPKSHSKLKAATLRVEISDGPDNRLRLSARDNGRLFRKLKLHDKKDTPLSRMAERIIGLGGSIFLIRNDVTELKISLPRQPA
ncbi:PAS sensor protein [Desulfovibrio sp. X2]|uniref:PAS domain-containing protein n=1 Tax=Desulfovibrio sp. X2 TaxID=941449 RepID=UPI000358AD6C|nr:PAS domain-containing protein [Desulfovibrio sp. X2]EPR44703.1 PAS sensor protein [Desulfovibrio sp. X2]